MKVLEWIGNHTWVFVVSAWVIILASVAKNVRERMRVAPLHAPVEAGEAWFEEDGASAASDLSTFTRIGCARNALVVRVLRDGVWIEPNAVIKALMRQNFNDLEHFIPRANLIGVERSSLARGAVTLEFRDQDGVGRKLWIELRNPEAFVNAIARLRGA